MMRSPSLVPLTTALALLLSLNAPASPAHASRELPPGQLAEVEITVSADNAYFLWIDGQPYSGANAAAWQRSDTYRLQLPRGEHSVAVYVEDWGGYAYFAATVRVDGELVSKTGDDSWLTWGVRYARERSRDTQRRGERWPSPPVDGVTGLEVRPPAGWTSASFDDRDWTVAPQCTHDRLPRYAAIPTAAWDSFDPLYADGAKFVFASSRCSHAARWLEVDGRDAYFWAIGLFRGGFSF